MSVHEGSPKEVDAFNNLIDTLLRKKHYDARHDRKYDYYHPSEIGKCLRRQQYLHYAYVGKIKKDYDPLDSKTYRLFDKGHNMHVRWKGYFGEIDNILMGRWSCTNPLCRAFDDNGAWKGNGSIERCYQKLDTRLYEGKNGGPILKPSKCVCGNKNFEYVETQVLSERLKLKGNADLVINCDNLNMKFFEGVLVNFDKRFLPTNGRKVVIDMKTIGSRQWDNQVKKHGVHKYYIIQVMIYIYVLGCDYGLVIYENKDDSSLATFKIERNDHLWEVIQFQLEEMVKMREVNLLPPPKASEKNEYMCSDCEFKSDCYSKEIWDDKNFEIIRNEFYKSTL